MRDVFAAIVALVLLIVAASLATTLGAHRRRRERQRDSERALGRTIVAEIPAGDDFVLVSEDDTRFHHGEQSIDKDLIVAVRLLINGAPIAAYESHRHATRAQAVPTDRQQRDRETAGVDEDHPEGILRDRWDVAIETVTGTTVIACGAIRERVSQEIARKIFEAIKGELERRDQ